MSREAAEDGRPDVAEDIGPAAMASESAESGVATAAGEPSEPPGPDEAAPPAEHAPPAWGDTGSVWDDPSGAPGADDYEAGDLSVSNAGDGALGTGRDDPLPPPRRWPRLLLAFGFVLLAVAIVGGAVAIVGSITHGFKKPVKVTYTKSPVFSLKTGNCLDPHGQSYTLISCDAPHEAEVFATFTLAGTAWPGSAKVAAAASSGCASRLTGYLNPQLAVSLASTYVYPDATAWQAGTRTVICEVRATSGELTGSVRGASATAG